MAALLVGSIALGVDKFKAHRAKGKEKAAAARAAALASDPLAYSDTSSTSTSTNVLQDENGNEITPTPRATKSGTSTRPGIEKRGRRGYTEFHAPTLSATSASTAAGGNEFVDDEKERLRRFYEERDRDGQGMRGRASGDLRTRDGLPGYVSAYDGDHAGREAGSEAQGQGGVNAQEQGLPPPPNYEVSEGYQGR